MNRVGNQSNSKKILEFKIADTGTKKDSPNIWGLGNGMVRGKDRAEGFTCKGQESE